MTRRAQYRPPLPGVLWLSLRVLALWRFVSPAAITLAPPSTDSRELIQTFFSWFSCHILSLASAFSSRLRASRAVRSAFVSPPEPGLWGRGRQKLKGGGRFPRPYPKTNMNLHYKVRLVKHIRPKPKVEQATNMKVSKSIKKSSGWSLYGSYG